MNYDPKSPKAGRVSEPVQVYLHRPDQDRLERLTERLGTSKSDALRRGLEALERQLTDPSDHPALRIIGLGESDPTKVGAADLAHGHDSALSDSEIASWYDADDREKGDGA
jgi:Arc/MetJ-type ribon-helix-helix transcriptional regulator